MTQEEPHGSECKNPDLLHQIEALKDHPIQSFLDHATFLGLISVVSEWHTSCQPVYLGDPDWTRAEERSLPLFCLLDLQGQIGNLTSLNKGKMKVL
jgi:hypothetical protein